MGSVHHPMRKRWPFLPIGQTILSGRIFACFQGQESGHGKQAGFQGNRSSLFFRIMYLVGQLREEDKPAYLLIENVKNLLSVNGGWDFARLLIEMDRGGTMRNGRCSTLRISECPRTGSEYSLSDILEADVPQKYFLSRDQVEKIIFTRSDS